MSSCGHILLQVGIRSPDSTKVFLYVADKKIVGLLLAERVAQGYRILPPTEGLLNSSWHH